MRKIMLILLALGLIAGTVWLSYRHSMGEIEDTPTATTGIGGDFTLGDQNGNAVTNQSLNGKYRLVYFGYTFCPDICPMALGVMGQALDALGKDGERIVPIFITFDPERDTAAHLKEYAANFTPRLLALTGTPEAVKQAADAYKVYYSKIDNPQAPQNYMMNHSSYIYLMDQTGHYLTHFPSNVSVDEMVRTLKVYVK